MNKWIEMFGAKPPEGPKRPERPQTLDLMGLVNQIGLRFHHAASNRTREILGKFMHELGARKIKLSIPNEVAMQVVDGIANNINTMATWEESGHTEGQIVVEIEHMLEAGDKERLLEAAEFIKTKTHTDTYYDTKDWKLSLRDIWLRKRNDRFELKMPTVIDGTVATHHFYEFETDDEIFEQLAKLGLLNTSHVIPASSESSRHEPESKLPKSGSRVVARDDIEGLEKILKENGYKPFASIGTTRTEYHKDGFTLDFDSSDFGFEILEIELMVENNSQTEEAIEKIKTFAASHGLPTVRTRGKVMTYIRKFHPDLYALQFPNGDGFEK